jgi:hypothetical protein
MLFHEIFKYMYNNYQNCIINAVYNVWFFDWSLLTTDAGNI